MSIRSLNHAVLFVSDVERSTVFYCEILGFERLPVDFPGGAFLRGAGSANDHDLGLFQASAPPAGKGAVGLYHLAWEVETLSELASAQDRLRAAGALTAPRITREPKPCTDTTPTASSSRSPGWYLILGSKRRSCPELRRPDRWTSPPRSSGMAQAHPAALGQIEN